MIRSFVDTWLSHRDQAETRIALKHPETYKDIVIYVLDILSEYLDEDNCPSSASLYEIQHGSYYEGTLVYVMTAKNHGLCWWVLAIFYGSCSGCDTLNSIRERTPYEEIPSQEQIKLYMTLCLHIVQNIKCIIPLDRFLNLV